MGALVSTPARKAARRGKLEELAAVALELEELDTKRDELASRRDVLLLESRAENPQPSLRDVAAIGKVSHAWVRKLERREGSS